MELPFTIAMAWWQTDWAWLSYLLAAIGLVGFVVVVRERASRRRERVLQALVDARTTSLQDANERLAHMSYHDSLTGLANRRHFDEQLEIEWKRGIRAGSPLAMLMLDIDRFKDFNDTRGHILGDACLQKVADVLERALPRASDMAARYGGDEFAVILPATDLSGAVTVAENLRQLVAAGTRAAGEPSGICHATISVGVAAVVPTLDVAPADLIRVADQALYLAKASGRDSVRTADWPVEPGPSPRS